MERTKASPRHYLAAALVGLGIAAIVYRVVALTFHDRSLLTWFMPVVGGVFAVAGVHLSRATSGPTGSSALKVLVGVIAFAPALLVMREVLAPPDIDRLAWTEHQGPGYEISMPASDTVTSEPPDVAVVAKVHLSIELPDYDVYDRRAAGFTLVSSKAYLTVDEVSSDMAWSADSVLERVRGAGYAVKLGKRLADGRWPFTTIAGDARPGDLGWFGTKVCGDRQVIVIAASSTKARQREILSAFRAARCTDDEVEY
ncbi:MAG TPA: hypothetical protein VGM39_00150 [Kofleriaceae bacterium]|jgi:hypothetical protein